METIMVTGASGHLGHLIINTLLKTLPASQIVAGARKTAKAGDLAARGIAVREVNYDHPETLDKAFSGIDKLLLISSNEVGKRVSQHKAVIEAAKKAGVKLLVYTSMLHADTSILGITEEHRQTEAALRTSGLPYVLLRNGWYTENYLDSVPSALQHGAFLGSAKEGRIASATRQDYADAAAAVLLSKEEQGGKIYELAGDESYTLADLAAEVSRQTGKDIIYKDLPENDYRDVLINAGLPEPFAAMLAESDTGASQGALYDESHHLSRLIGRPTTSLKAAVAAIITN